MRYIAAVSIVLLWICPVHAERHTINVEQACFNQIQGRIAWNHAGDRRWNPGNIHNLCRGTRNHAEPGQCFHQLMHAGLDWGARRRWGWQNAIALCHGSNDAGWTIACFRQGLSHHLGWDEAIAHCSGMNNEYERYPDYGFAPGWQRPTQRRVTCQELVQGRIAWNDQGDTIWADHYLNRLCHGSEFPAEPGRCYVRVMHGGVNWGGGTHWEPDNVLDLCAGSNNAERTIRCFEDAIHRGRHWESAISHCSR